MQIGKIGRSILATFVLMSGGCASANYQPEVLFLEPNTTSISGWLSNSGEWMLFARPLGEDYNPYTSDETERCISIVNDTGIPRREFSRYGGKHVKAVGHAERYSSLKDGETQYDRLLSKKYYKNESVENSCGRDYIFVATSLLAED